MGSRAFNFIKFANLSQEFFFYLMKQLFAKTILPCLVVQNQPHSFWIRLETGFYLKQCDQYRMRIGSIKNWYRTILIPKALNTNLMLASSRHF